MECIIAGITNYMNQS